MKAKVSAILTTLVLLNSCNQVSHKNFTAYKKSPFDSNSAPLKIDGIYFMKPYRNVEHAPPHFFFLFSDGSLTPALGSGISTIPDNQFWNDPKKFMNHLNTRFGNDGQYFVRGKEIVMQLFEINPGAFFAINSLELHGTVKNDSSIVLTNGICNWCPNTFLNYKEGGTVDFDSVEYRYYKTKIRPDSSNIWFKKKKWYKMDVWNKSR